MGFFFTYCPASLPALLLVGSSDRPGGSGPPAGGLAAHRPVAGGWCRRGLARSCHRKALVQMEGKQHGLCPPQ
jgi:hypothetical protein